MDQRYVIFFGIIAISAVFIVIAEVLPIFLWPLKLLFIVIGLAFDILAFSSRFYLYLVSPLISQRKRFIVLSQENPYTLSESSDVVVTKRGENFIATIFIEVPLYVSATEMQDEAKFNFAMQVGKLMSISPYPIKFSNQTSILNKDEYIQSLHHLLSMAQNDELKISENKDLSPSDINRIKGKVSMWQNILDNVSNVQSFDQTIFAEVSAEAPKDYEAITLAQQRAREVMSGINSILGVMPVVATGADILKFLEPEYIIPSVEVKEKLARVLSDM
ncbi:MAG: hypothetical protein ACP5RP_00975 [Candidatus Micrarchaeia archaeon]